MAPLFFMMNFKRDVKENDAKLFFCMSLWLRLEKGLLNIKLSDELMLEIWDIPENMTKQK